MATILIIDDSESILAFSQEALEKDGHNVFIARSGIEANKIIFSKNKPDLIMLDIIMPLLDGEKVIQAFQQSEIGRKIPVVFFSTKTEEELASLVKKHNNRGYIKKPIGAKELRTAVRDFLRKASKPGDTANT